MFANTDRRQRDDELMAAARRLLCELEEIEVEQE